MTTALRLGASALALCLGATSAMAFDTDFYKKAGEGFSGVTLHGVTESTPASNYVREVLAPKFKELTGITVDLETTSWDQMYDKAIKDMEAGTGIYDFVYIEQDIIYAYLGRKFLVDLTAEIAANPAIKVPDYDEKNFTSFANYFRGDNGGLYGVPMEAFVKPYVYRTDLFSDPEIMKAFKEKTGRDLAPAKTHAEYTEIAEFFTQWGKDHNLELWGTTAQAHTGHASSWYEFFESVAPTFGVYNWGIDAANNYGASVEHGGRMNSPEAKAALKYWLHLRDIAPPESVQSTWSEVATTMAAGRAAQGLVYGENVAWIGTDESKSKVVGKISVALPPMEPGVQEAAAEGKGYIGYYDGGAFGVPITSKNQQAATLFLEFIAEQEVQADWTLAGSRITTTATYDDPKVKELNTKLSGYFDMMRDDGKLFGGAPPYPFHGQVREATAPIFYDILTGKIDPDTGLDQMAAKTEQELTDLGYRQ